MQRNPDAGNEKVRTMDGRGHEACAATCRTRCQARHRTTRRAALRRIAGGLLASGCVPFSAASGPAPCSWAAPAERPARHLGIVAYARLLRRKWLKQQAGVELLEPRRLLEHCRKLGAGGIQVPLGTMSESEAAALAEQADRQKLFIDAIIDPPGDAIALARFEAEVRTAARVGVRAARTVVMPGRRYERFQSLEEFRQAERRARHMLELAAPVVEKHRVRLAVENHKDQRVEERAKLLKAIDSQYVGACVDVGNSVALLEDPIETVRGLAPWAMTVHLKDQAVKACADGFLLADIPLGQGALDLKRMVTILREAKPDIHFALELITRDPLKVPCLTDAYWATLGCVSGRELARMLRFVRHHEAQRLQQVSQLPLADQVRREDANIAASLEYARERLGL